VCVACPADQFKCRNTGECVVAAFQCDGYDNCGDWSDELNCSELIMYRVVGFERRSSQAQCSVISEYD